MFVLPIMRHTGRLIQLFYTDALLTLFIYAGDCLLLLILELKLLAKVVCDGFGAWIIWKCVHVEIQIAC